MKGDSKEKPSREDWLNEMKNTTVRFPRRFIFALQRASVKKGVSQSAYLIQEADGALKEFLKEVDREFLGK